MTGEVTHVVNCSLRKCTREELGIHLGGSVASEWITDLDVRLYAIVF